jgi:hypothetical protein
MSDIWITKHQKTGSISLRGLMFTVFLNRKGIFNCYTIVTFMMLILRSDGAVKVIS